MKVFEWLQFDWTELFMPGACIGRQGFLSRLLLVGLLPLGVMVLILLVGWAGYAAMNALTGTPQASRAEGLLKMLPSVLFLSFALCTSVSSSIFAAWSCLPFDDDSQLGTIQLFLRADLSVRCTDGSYMDPAHRRITATAGILAVIWTGLLPAAYVIALLPIRKHILKRRSTPLVRATAFLHRECA